MSVELSFLCINLTIYSLLFISMSLKSLHYVIETKKDTTMGMYRNICFGILIFIVPFFKAVPYTFMAAHKEHKGGGSLGAKTLVKAQVNPNTFNNNQSFLLTLIQFVVKPNVACIMSVYGGGMVRCTTV